jgi:hypothetical protein
VTDLFTACAGLPARFVTEAIPPSVRRAVERAPIPRRDGRDVVLELGPWVPRVPASHLLPSLALLTSHPYTVRFEVSARRGGEWTSWVATTTLGNDAFAAVPAVADGLTADIDEVHAVPPVDAVRLRVRLAGDAAIFDDASWLIALSAWNGVRPPRVTIPWHVPPLGVPARTQMSEPAAVRLRICSPTSIGMALEYFGRPIGTMALADAVFHAHTDRYGVWPAAVRAAAAHGVPGYLLRFPDWETAAWCLTRKLPIIASVRFGQGELTNAPIADTTGHLVVITGLSGANVLVNDPAAPDIASVPRRYDREEFTAAWLDKTGVGYVFFAPS